MVRALQRHRANGKTREPGDVYAVPPELVPGLVSGRYAVVHRAVPDWWARSGRELRVVASGTSQRPVVACLNIWNDAPALAQTLPMWAGYVHALVVADGPYQTTGCTGLSTDALDKVLVLVPEVERVPMPGDAWPDQLAKRTALLQHASRVYPDAMLLVLDADEMVEGAECLRNLPDCDVGWVRVANPSLYSRRYDQPRLVRASPALRYGPRHHHLMDGDRLLVSHQYGGTGVLHRLIGLSLTNLRGLGHTPARREAKQRHARAQYTREVPAALSPRTLQSDHAVGARDALHILQLSTYDPGLVAYRLHTGLNCTTPHAAVLGTDQAHNPFGAPGQYDLQADHGMLAAAWDEADIVHLHLDYQCPRRLGRELSSIRWRVIHHHGTMLREKPGASYYNAVDPAWAKLRLVSNLELLHYGAGLHWLPNPMPVAAYRRLRARVWRASPVFRVAHSPSKRFRKGTEAFLSVIERLQARHVPVEAVLIEGVSHAVSLARKAECDAVFDSFDLGIQCSGLEGAAMGLPVVAGDATVAGEYRRLLGEVPYTYAADEAALEAVLERLSVDVEWRNAEASRVARYTEEHHDEAAVALRLLDLYDDAFGWRAAMTERRTTRKPEPAMPKPKAVTHAEPEPATVHVPPEPLTRTA